MTSICVKQLQKDKFGSVDLIPYLYRVKQIKPHTMKTITIVKIALVVAVLGSITIFTLSSI